MKKIGRNDPCQCGSGKKYKQCCMRADGSRAQGDSGQVSAPHLELQLGFSHQAAGRLVEAEQIYRRVLRAHPGYAEAWHLLGIVAGERGEYEKAAELIGKAIGFQETNHNYHANLGRMFSYLGAHARAESCYRRAVALNPVCAHYSGLGNALRAQDKFAEAVESYRQALAVDPNFAEAYRNLGDTFNLQGRLEEALAQYRHALSLDPHAADIHSNLGAMLALLGRSEEAVSSYRRAVELNPGMAAGYSNLATALQAIGDLDGALDNFRKALALEPDYLRMRDRAKAEQALRASVHDTVLYIMSIHAGCSPADYLAEARRYGGKLAAMAKPYTRWPQCEASSGRLRVGLVSADLRNHSVGFFLEGVVAHLKSSGIDLIAYSVVPTEDELTARIKPNFSEWHSLAELGDQAAARKIHDDGIHILIDLGGYTANNRMPLFAWKAAPIQVSWLGFWAGTGLDTIDYVICDPWSLPSGERQQFIEQPWYLPETRLCFTVSQDDIPCGPSPALANGFITFGCFNNITKMNAAVVALWARILARVENSRLILKSPLFKDDSIRQSTWQRFAAHGIEHERLILQEASERNAYLASYNQIDIALDPFPFAGGTTSIDGLWMGVPLITLRGDRMIAHQGESILQNLGLQDWIAEDEDTYMEMATAKAADVAALVQLRTTLRARLLASPLCDAERFARNLERALQEMWSK
jgi:predicted O-linked N-acetylglucosamine transferase (SPINDLY family)